MNKLVPNDPPGVADDESPEWTDDDFLWSINNTDFGGHAAALEFLTRREEFFRAASKVGFEREAFLSLLPSKPGFLERAATALEALSLYAKHAAE